MFISNNLDQRMFYPIRLRVQYYIANVILTRMSNFLQTPFETSQISNIITPHRSLYAITEPFGIQELSSPLLLFQNASNVCEWHSFPAYVSSHIPNHSLTHSVSKIAIRNRPVPLLSLLYSSMLNISSPTHISLHITLTMSFRSYSLEKYVVCIP